MRIILCFFAIVIFFELKAQEVLLSNPRPGACYQRQYCAPVADTIHAEYPVYVGTQKPLRKYVYWKRFIYVAEKKELVARYPFNDPSSPDSILCLGVTQEEVSELLPIVKKKKLNEISPELVEWRNIQHLNVQEGRNEWIEILCEPNDIILRQVLTDACAAIQATEDTTLCRSNMTNTELYNILKEFERKHDLKAAECLSENTISIETLEYLGVIW